MCSATSANRPIFLFFTWFASYKTIVFSIINGRSKTTLSKFLVGHLPPSVDSGGISPCMNPKPLMFNKVQINTLLTLSLFFLPEREYLSDFTADFGHVEEALVIGLKILDRQAHQCQIISPQRPPVAVLLLSVIWSFFNVFFFLFLIWREAWSVVVVVTPNSFFFCGCTLVVFSSSINAIVFWVF